MKSVAANVTTSHWAAAFVPRSLTSNERHEKVRPSNLERTVRAAMRLSLMEPNLGLSSGGARSKIRTLPVRAPHVPP